MDEFIGEILGEMIIVPLLNAVAAGVWWVMRNGVVLGLYPIMLLTGWLRLWLRERGRTELLLLWHTHGRAGLHRFGWQEAAVDVECLTATGLIVMAVGGIWAMIYAVYGLFIS